jgi:glucose-6-phosphate isomerase
VSVSNSRYRGPDQHGCRQGTEVTGVVTRYSSAPRHYGDRRPTLRFVSNIDGSDFAQAVRDLGPAVTLLIISSKTSTTLETMTNARTRAWSLAGLGVDNLLVANHFVAVSTNAAEVTGGAWNWARSWQRGSSRISATAWTVRSITTARRTRSSGAIGH